MIGCDLGSRYDIRISVIGGRWPSPSYFMVGSAILSSMWLLRNDIG